MGGSLLDQIVGSSSKVGESTLEVNYVQARMKFDLYPATILDEEKNHPGSRHAKTTRLL